MKSFLLAFTLLLFISCKSNSEPDPVLIDGETSKVYTTYCAGCHGQQLQQFKTLQTYELSIEEISEVISEGNADLGMPGFKATLSMEQMEDIAVYIREYNYESNHIAENESGDRDYTVETIVDGLEIPWGMEFLPNGDLLIAEKEGVLSRFNPTDGLVEISGVPEVRDNGQGGLLDLRLHPDYARNGWVYISYSYVEGRGGNTAIIRGKIQNNALVDVEEIYRGSSASSRSIHYGSRMVFDNEGYLYFSNGDRGQRDDFPQELDNSNGKIHRLHDDGRIPSDNPFVGQAGAVESIYSYGHRNPQGMALHPATGEVWEHEHGPQGGDEINIISKGLNYGWPVISYGINYDGSTFTDLTEQEGMAQPVYYYVPSIAPCGMEFVTGDRYPNWKNNLLIGALKDRYLERLELNGNQVVYQEKLLDELNSRVRNVRMGPDGYIYVAVEGPGRILKLLPVE